MSSTWHVLFLSHDPAITVSEHSFEEEAEEAIDGGFESHANCDFLIVRRSGAPVEVICTGRTEARVSLVRNVHSFGP